MGSQPKAAEWSNMKNNSEVSVIVPVFNTEKYLPQCIESVLKQSVKNIEIILVDDGSTDSSGTICDKYAKKYDCVQVLHKKNGGHTSARKAGLRLAKSEYVMWIDSDDWIEADFIENIKKIADCTQADIVTSNLYFEIGGDSKIVRNFFAEGLYSRDDLLPNMIYSGEFFEYGMQPHLCTKLIKKNILEKVFPQVDEEIVVGEDAAITYASILNADTVYISELCSYHYIQHPGSVTKSYLPDEKERILKLYHCLLSNANGTFREMMYPQLNQYIKYLLILRDIVAFDFDSNTFLNAYGGISRDSRIVIYGAGGVGQQIYSRLTSNDLSDQVVCWIDRNYLFYKEKGLVVEPVETIACLNDEYDAILIANTSQKAADSIRTFLLQQGVPDDKILWFSQDILNEKIMKLH